MAQSNIRLVHIGINGADNLQAAEFAKSFSDAFGLEYKPGESSVFAGNLIEVMCGNGRGKVGHIGLSVDSIEDLEDHLSNLGHPFVQSTLQRGKNGEISFVYLHGDFGGFSVHLSRN